MLTILYKLLTLPKLSRPMSGPLSTEKERNDSNHSSSSRAKNLGGGPQWVPSHRRHRRRHQGGRVHDRVQCSGDRAHNMDQKEEAEDL